MRPDQTMKQIWRAKNNNPKEKVNRKSLERNRRWGRSQQSGVIDNSNPLGERELADMTFTWSSKIVFDGANRYN